MKKAQHRKVIISGGGTGGHIFPAIAIARALLNEMPAMDILFVGAEGKMEMEKVPAAGFEIVGLPIAGWQRRISATNLRVGYNLVRSLTKARKLLTRFGPDAVVGTGGYASGPVLYMASRKKIPTLIQEQNSFPGVTNRILSRRASRICVAFEGMDRFFPPDKIIFTGNPVREGLVDLQDQKEKGYRHFGLDARKKTLLVLGGSLGARTINDSVIGHLSNLMDSGLQVIWQSGRYYFEQAHRIMEEKQPENILLFDFIHRMELAYSVADLVISRAGAGTISELSVAAKPAILVPSPNVAEDHQTKNALALVEKKAAVMVEDGRAADELILKGLDLIQQPGLLNALSGRIHEMARPHSAQDIAREVIKLWEEK